MTTAPEELTYYVIYDDGSASRIVTDIGTEPVLAKPGRLVTEADYQAVVDAMTADRVQQAEEEQAQREAQGRADYDALIAAGLPAGTAARLSGYTPPAEVTPEGGGA